jgi:integrase
MSVKNAGTNVWKVQAVFRVPGQKNPVTRRETVYGTRADALRKEAELKYSDVKPIEPVTSIKTVRQPAPKQTRSLTEPKVNEPTVRTFGDAVALYVENLRAKGRLSHGHHQQIRGVSRVLGELPISQVPERFAVYRRVLMATHSNNHVNHITAIVKAVYNRQIALELLDKNPITNVKYPKLEEKPRDRYFVDDERERLLDAINTHRPYIYPIVRYMMLVPCRRGELVGAKREQYQAKTQTIYIPDSKAGIPLHKPIPMELRDYFASILKECPWLFYKVGDNGDYRQITAQVLKDAWAVCLDKASIEDLRLHDLRHVSATDLYERGIPERVIMDVAGWKTPMLSTYRHKSSLKSVQSIII